MTPENSFSLDIDAEQRAVSGSIVSPDSPPSQLINVMQDIPLANGNESQIINVLKDQSLSDTSTANLINIHKELPLPQPIPFLSTEVPIRQEIKPQLATSSGVNFTVKMEAEQAYKKTEQLEKKISEMRGGIEDFYNEMKKSWIPNSNRDDFEERPTTEPNNLIFEARRTRMSLQPPWA